MSPENPIASPRTACRESGHHWKKLSFHESMCNEIVTGRGKNRGIDAGVTTRSGMLEGDGEHFKELLASSGSIIYAMTSVVPKDCMLLLKKYTEGVRGCPNLVNP